MVCMITAREMQEDWHYHAFRKSQDRAIRDEKITREKLDITRLSLAPGVEYYFRCMKK